jgi:hypothetical protein
VPAEFQGLSVIVENLRRVKSRIAAIFSCSFGASKWCVVIECMRDGNCSSRVAFLVDPFFDTDPAGASRPAGTNTPVAGCWGSSVSANKCKNHTGYSEAL